MGKQENFWKCGSRHFPPTGNRCDKLELLSSANVNRGIVTMAVTGCESEKDFYAIPSNLSLASSAQGVQEDLQKQVLDQLQR